MNPFRGKQKYFTKILQNLVSSLNTYLWKENWNNFQATFLHKFHTESFSRIDWSRYICYARILIQSQAPTQTSWKAWYKKTSCLECHSFICFENCSPELAPTITCLFQISSDSGIFRDFCKRSRLQPNSNKGCKSLPYNYCPFQFSLAK